MMAHRERFKIGIQTSENSRTMRLRYGKPTIFGNLLFFLFIHFNHNRLQIAGSARVSRLYYRHKIGSFMRDKISRRDGPA